MFLNSLPYDSYAIFRVVWDLQGLKICTFCEFSF